MVKALGERFAEPMLALLLSPELFRRLLLLEALPRLVESLQARYEIDGPH